MKNMEILKVNKPLYWSVKCVNIRRGDIYYADLRPVVGFRTGWDPAGPDYSDNDVGNRHSPTVICAAITSKMKAKLPTHVEIGAGKYEIVKDSVILLEQLRTIDKRRLRERVCHLDEEALRQVDRALQISLELLT